MGERNVVVTGGSPWGMRLTGGKDFGSPLMVSKVTPGSKSACAGVQDSDYVLQINGQDTKEMMHMDAQNCIKRSGDMLRLLLTQAKPKWAGVEITGTVAPTSSLAPARPAPPPAPPTARTPPAAPAPSTTRPPPAAPAPPTARPPPAAPAPPTARTTPTPPAPPTARTPPAAPPSGVTFRTTPYTPPPPSSSPTVTYQGGLKPAGYDPSKFVEYSPTPVAEAGLDSSQSKQSPAYSRILMADEVPFGHASAEKGLEKRTPTQPPAPPPAPTTPPTRQFQNIRITQGNVVKTSERPAGYYPPPPPGVASRPVPVSPKSIDTSNLPKPTPPPAASAPPPPSPTRMAKDGLDTGRTPPSPGGGPAKLSTRQGDCEKCKQPIRGPYASALGRFWHPEHFICAKCYKQLSNQTFVVEGDEPYCEPCYEKSVAPMCEECKHTITGAYVCAVNRFWHKEHFKCFICKRHLGTEEGFNYEGGHLYCTACYSEQFGVICAGCNKVIGGADLWVEALEKNWHPHCFVCESCRAPLEGGTFFVKLGRPYCRLHR